MSGDGLHEGDAHETQPNGHCQLAVDAACLGLEPRDARFDGVSRPFHGLFSGP